MPLLAGKEEIGHNIHEMEKAGHPHKQAVAAALHKAYDAAHAAGVLLTHGDRALFLKRSDKSRDHAGEWCCPGGSIEGGETPEQAAHREMQEETGLAGLLTGDFNRIDDGDGFVTFRQSIEDEPTPTLNEEHTEAMWAPMSDPPQPLHPGVAATLKKLSSKVVDCGMDAEFSMGQSCRFNGKSACGTVEGMMPVKVVNPHSNAHKVTKTETSGKRTRMYEGGNVHLPTATVERAARGDRPAKQFEAYWHTLQEDGAAQDKREWDTNGWFEVLDNPLSTIGVYPYREASVIKGGSQTKMVNVFRPPEELSSEEAVKSFRLTPWTDDHPDALLGPAEQGLVPAESKGVHGVIGEQTYYRDGTLYGNIKVFSEELARKQAAGKRELSLGYRCDFVPQEGIYEGTAYQYVQKNIRGNHMSSVKSGRMGSGVRVLDAADVPFEYFTFALDLKEVDDMPVCKECGMAHAPDTDCMDADTIKAEDAKNPGGPGSNFKGTSSQARGLEHALAGLKNSNQKSPAWNEQEFVSKLSPQDKEKWLRMKSGRDEEEQKNSINSETLDFISDSFESLVGELEKKGYSKGYATKVAGKVAAEKGMTGHDSIGNLNEDKTMPKAATDGEAKNPTEKGDSPGEKGDLAGGSKTKDSMTEEEEAGMDAKEEAKDAEEEKADKEKDDKEARDRKSARDRRGGARDARKSARDKAKDARDKAAKDEAEKKAAADAKGKGMDAAEVTALVQKEVTAATAGLSQAIRKEEAAKLALYGRVSPLVGAFDHAEMTHVAMATYALDKLGAPKTTTDPVTALDFYLAGRTQAVTPYQRSAQDSATNGESFVDKYLGAA